MARKRRRHGEPRLPPIHITTRADWGRALEVGGVTQSISVPPDEPLPAASDPDAEPQPGPRGGYWGLMLPPGCPRRALLLGLGGGTIATLLARRCPDTAITGVERDPAIITAARQELGLDALPWLTIEQADAFAWMETRVGDPQATETPDLDERFELICVDLFEAGRLAMGTLATRFLRQVAALLTPDGSVTLNLMMTGRTGEQVHRVERVFTVQRRLRTRGNLILHLAPRPTTSQFPHD